MPQLDKVGPQLQSLLRVGPTRTNADTVEYTATFSEPVTGVDVSNFSLVTSGVSGASIASVVPVAGTNGAQYSIFVNTGAGDGTIALKLTGTDIQDTAGNPWPSGTFAPGVSYAVEREPRSVLAGDLDGDGNPDLLALNLATSTSATGRLSVLLGNGDGTFQPKVSFYPGSNPSSVVESDLNGDGKLDLVVSSAADNAMSVLLGNGNGTFQPALNTFFTGSTPMPAVGTASHALAVGDVNGDGKPDVIFSTHSTGRAANGVSVLLGNGDGTFQSRTEFPLTNNSSPETSSLQLADMNGDGRPDIVELGGVLLGNGNGTFQSEIPFDGGQGRIDEAVADFNGDGILDVAVVNQVAPNYAVSVLLGNGDGTFRARTTYSVGAFPTAIAVGDVNGDGNQDIATSNFDGGSITLLLGNGDGTFQPQTSLSSGGNPRSVTMADINP